MTDLCDSLICESVYGGFLMNCPDQELCREIIPYLSAIQQGRNRRRFRWQLEKKCMRFRCGGIYGYGRRDSDDVIVKGKSRFVLSDDWLTEADRTKITTLRT